MNRRKAKWLKISVAATLVMALIISTVATVAAGPPTEAPGNSDVAIVPLGKAFDKDGREVEGLMIIHYKRGFGHKPKHNPGGNGGGGDTSSTCFAFLANGARWKTTEDYLVDPSNNGGLPQGAVPGIVATSLGTWDAAETSNFTIFGSNLGAGGVDGIDLSSPDDKNEVLFGDIGSPGAIAVTVGWGIFRGPPFMRELVEWDALFDDADFDWSTSGEAGKMDFQNIATHEFGHSVGMGHPDDSCTEETMYRFASNGETKKRDLNTGDIAGINELY